MATAVDARVAVPEGAAPSERRLEAVATLLSCVGLLIQVIGYAWGWHGDEATAIGLWYVGFVGIVVPFAWLLLAPSRTGHQRLGAALAFGLIMYASWFLTNPIMSTRFDETLHVTTLVDMVDQHSFFYPELHAAGLAALPGPGVRHRRGALADRAPADRLPGAGRGDRTLDVHPRAVPAGQPDRPLHPGGCGDRAALRRQRPVLLLQRPVQLPDRRDRDADGRALPAGARVRLRGGTALAAADRRTGVPRRPGHHPPPHQLADARPALAAGAVLLARRRGAAGPAHPDHRRARHGGGPGVDRDHRAAADQLPRADLRRRQQPAAQRSRRERRRQEPRRGRRRHPHSHLGADGDGRLDPALDGDAGPVRLAGLAARQPRADPGALHPAGHRRDLSRPAAGPVRAVRRGGGRPGLDVRHAGDGAGRGRVAGSRGSRPSRPWSSRPW